tara:strand:- start:2589 stop:3446 length:858 start_codon:yes stop_codon:yes gene_type:complete
MTTSTSGGMLIPQELSMLVSSDPSQGAKNVTPDGSQFNVQLSEPISIPKNALNCTLTVEQSTVWWTIPNIVTGSNNTMYITGPDVANVTTAYTVVIPQGLYDLSGISQAVLRDLENQGAKISPNPLINFAPDEPTQKVEIKFNYAVCEIDFTQGNTPRTILGFDSQILGPYASAPIIVLADNVANFNTVNSLLLHSDLISKGIRFNDDYNQTISQVLIDVPPGSQIVSQQFNPAKIEASDLVGGKRGNFRVWLTDDANQAVNTNSEFFTLRIVIRYLLPYVVGIN